MHLMMFKQEIKKNDANCVEFSCFNRDQSTQWALIANSQSKFNKEIKRSMHTEFVTHKKRKKKRNHEGKSTKFKTTRVLFTNWSQLHFSSYELQESSFQTFNWHILEPKTHLISSNQDV
jgi:hypothetical protein